MRPPELVVTDAAVALGRALRARGVAAGVEEELVLCRALAEIDLRSREQVYWAARASFLRHRGEVAAFDEIFAHFWAGLPLERPAAVAEHGEGDPRMPGPQHGGESLPKFGPEGRSGHVLDGGANRAASPLDVEAATGEEPGRGSRRGMLAAYSAEEVLTEREPLRYGVDELAAVRRLAEDLRRAAPERRSRRPRPARRADRFDVRGTVRRSLETDGEALRPAYLSHSVKPRRLLFLCDVSGSMERYSRALLGSLHAAVGATPKTEAFVFATRLTRLTGTLARRDGARALERARDAVDDWSGGTRIGHALQEFNRRYAPLGLARGAVVVILSDGWDRGDPDVLARELARLRLQCRRLIWLNPRPAQLDGQPLAVGMRAALPYIDDFVAGHDPRAIAALPRVVSGLGATRPTRRQRPSINHA